ncbi:tetratricopeptide repeat protein, partial [Candidatus Sumerlaeota bacterium]|nr:tetratricopeptide repeat protein [Candidatus Sumerlaeota bacterium]
MPAEAKKPLVKGDWATVLSVLEKADLKNPDTPCRMVAAHACLARNRGNEALILFLTSSDREEINNWKAWTKTLAEQQPQSGVAHYLQADALARTGDLAAAEQAFTRSIQHDPKLALALVGRGAVRALQRKDDPAYLDLMQATQVQPDLADAHASLGCFEVMQQNAEGALAAFNDALKLDPTSALAYNGRGCARYGLGKPDEAFVDFEMAATLCQALVIAEANQSFVEALVAKMIDEKTALLNKPGATLETKTGKVGPQSQLLDDKALRTAYEKEGFLALSQRLIRERQDLLGKMNENNKWMQQKYMAGVGALGNQLMAIEGTKVAVRYMTMGEAGLKGGLPGFFAQGGFYLAKDVADRQLDRALPEPVTRAVAKTIVAGISLQDDKFDWLGAGLAAGKERVTAAIADLHARADVRVKEQVGLGLM